MNRSSEEKQNDVVEMENTPVSARVFSMVKAELYRQYRVQSHFKIYLYRFFAVLTIIEYIFMMFLFVTKAFLAIDFPEEVLIAYMGSVFVQTIGGILLMVKYAFDSKKETDIISVLTDFVKNKETEK